MILVRKGGSLSCFQHLGQGGGFLQGRDEVGLCLQDSSVRVDMPPSTLAAWNLLHSQSCPQSKGMHTRRSWWLRLQRKACTAVVGMSIECEQDKGQHFLLDCCQIEIWTLWRWRGFVPMSSRVRAHLHLHCSLRGCIHSCETLNWKS